MRFQFFFLSFSDHCVEIFDLLESAGVPLIVFSAGLGDLIDIFLEQKLGKVPENCHLISNMMKFDENVRMSEREKILRSKQEHAQVKLC